MEPSHTKVLIIGASISGLASAACLQRRGIEYLIIEKQDRVAAPWHTHYERLHLHTSKRCSHLPYKKFGNKIPRYPNRQQVIDYLDDYQREFGISPQFHTEALAVKREGDHWITETKNGSFRSTWVIMATGAYGKPKPIRFSGMETFPGKIVHSHAYKTGKEFKGQNVLVVGFGNSACEIAIDLYEQGAMVSMSVRSAVNVIPRDVLGVPVQELSLLLNPLSPRVADALSAPLLKFLTGELSGLGLRKLPYGPLEQIRRDGSAPVLDIGTIRLIRAGHIGIFGEIDRLEGGAGDRVGDAGDRVGDAGDRREGGIVHFTDGKKKAFDAIVAGIGYWRDYAEIVDVEKNRFEDLRVSAGKQKYFGQDGLYFCGYWISPTGQIREIASDAKKITKDIAAKDGHIIM